MHIYWFLSSYAACLLLNTMVCFGAGAVDEFEDPLAALKTRFYASKPTVVLDYDAAYQLLFLEFDRVAAVRIALTEGDVDGRGDEQPGAGMHDEFPRVPGGRAG
jgi:hypothetical protein